METPVNQKEYLKKYLGIGKLPGEKKKKKKPKGITDRVKIIDDDADSTVSNIIIEDDLQNEDAPQIVAIIDERPPSLRVDDKTKNPLWQPIGSVDSVNTQGQKQIIPGFKIASKSTDKQFMQPVNRPPKRKTDFSKLKPNIIEDYTSKKNNVIYDESSPQRCDNDDVSPSRKKASRDSSPLRKGKKEDSSPRKKVMDDFSPETILKNDDISPPRKSRDEDNSPPRKRRNDDISPPRKRRYEDNSSLRKQKMFSSPRGRRNDDISPSRRSRNKDNSPQRKPKNEDISPSRRRRNDDISPPRRTKSVDTSPARRRKRSNSPPSKNTKLSDASPPRGRIKNEDKEKRTRGISAERKKMDKTLDGKTAGLQDAQHLVEETNKIRQREDQLFKNLSKDETGENAETVFRDRKSGKIRNLEEEEERQRKKLEEEEKNKAKYSRWGRGLVQVENRDQKMQEELYEMSKPLARYADDEDLERFLKEQERDGDPMLQYIRNKKRKKLAKAGIVMKPEFEGNFMPNRFGIKPGHRWDGVDRSNGYEKRWFEVQNAKTAQREDVYKWSTEDM